MKINEDKGSDFAYGSNHKEAKMKRLWVYLIGFLFLLSCNKDNAIPNRDCNDDFECPGGYYCSTVTYSCELLSARSDDNTDPNGNDGDNIDGGNLPNCTMEICDGLDNDCDGIIDEGCECLPQDKLACGESKGTCVPGIMMCEQGEWSSYCLGSIDPQDEICDGLDNDCDGTVDEDCACTIGSTKSCGTSVGNCRSGIQTCNNGQWSSCESEVLPTEEICDGLDNDCNGEVDETCECVVGFMRECGINQGVCHSGIEECPDGFWTECQNSIEPETETCDGLDNDCDGQIDEGCSCVDGDVLVCGKDEGVCASGEQTCENGEWSDCVGSQGPQTEVCDGLDNDCDGLADETFNLVSDVKTCGSCSKVCNIPHSNFSCDQGECVIISCQDGYHDINGDIDDGCEYECWLTRDAEYCDDIDNDCDGVVDNGFDKESDPENCGVCGHVCINTLCVNGDCAECAYGFADLNGISEDGCEYACEDQGEEICCDDKDNDCDGSRDEGCDCGCVEGELRTCGEFEQLGECVFGYQRCDENKVWSACIGSTPPQPKTCNDKDNDCNGIVDNQEYDFSTDHNNCGACGNVCSFANAFSDCVEGTCVIDSCYPGYIDMDANYSNGCEYPCHLTNDGIEQCDGIDNDCDGTPDDGYDLSSDVLNCGSCNHACVLSNAVPGCFDGKCYVAGCADGWVDLNENPADGCEYPCSYKGPEQCDLGYTDEDCDGSRNEDCSCADGEYQLCGDYQELGLCINGHQDCVNNAWSECHGGISPQPEQCDGLDNDCDGYIDEDFDFASNVDYCGSCEHSCIVQNGHAEFSCANAQCHMGGCQDGYHDLNSDPSNGCEYGCFETNNGREACDGIDNDCNGLVDEVFDLANDPNNCGQCKNVCKTLHAVPACVEGTCAVGLCEVNYVDLNHDPLDGCEYYCEDLDKEVCGDNLDNNCDGVADEGCPCTNDDVSLCGEYPDLRPCVLGRRVCENGVWGDCLGGVLPQAETCDNIDNDCNGIVDNGYDLSSDSKNCGACGVSCFYPNSTYSCSDYQCTHTCYPGFQDLNGLASDGCEYGCLATLGGVEVCDGIDNDCNGLVDEWFDLNTDVNNCGACNNKCEYIHADPVCNQGVCEMSTCLAGYTDANKDSSDGCEYLCTPEGEEVCDGADNDCNGITDDGCECQIGDQDVCGESNVNQCKYGIKDCIDGFWSECLGDVNPIAELCDGLDNDCDVLVDEDFDLEKDLNNCGECGNKCAFENGYADCQKSVCVMIGCFENYYDFVNGDSDGCETSCVPTNGNVEQCDGIDNDCDSQVDEGFDLKTDELNCGSCGNSCRFVNADAVCENGVCAMVDCAPDFYDADLNPDNGCEYYCQEFGAEVCDGLDNDCNGIVDDNCLCIPGDAPLSCGNGTGECEYGRRFCNADGTWSECQESTDPVLEVCDGLDNDCDGLVDEDFNLAGDILNCGKCGTVCAFDHAGAFCSQGVCERGQCDFGYNDFNQDPNDGCETLCTPTNGGQEQCDGIDNNCNGLVDEGFDLSFDLDNCGECNNKCDFSHAVSACSDGACILLGCEIGFVDSNKDQDDGCEYSCTYLGLEQCDKDFVDENCDGSRNEGCLCVNNDSFSCGTDEGTCKAGVQTCRNGQWSICENQILPSLEICDELDNDCDGQVDEGFNKVSDINHCGYCNHVCNLANATSECVAKECEIHLCDSGWVDLDRFAENGCEYPCHVTNNGVEICDYADNDCNGVVDEGFDLNSDPKNCGACGHVCELPNAINSCVWGQCQVAACIPGNVDVNKEPQDGCEYACEIKMPEENLSYCDGIDNDCDRTIDENCSCVNGLVKPCGSDKGQCFPGGIQTCRNGEWSSCEGEIIPMPEICDGLDNDCDGVNDNGFDFANDSANCGSCGKTCGYSHAITQCENSACVLKKCADGFYDLNHLSEDGCEYACTVTNGGIERCDQIDNDCDGLVDEGFDLETDQNNCGACGNRCSFVHGIASCENSQCVMIDCSSNYYDQNHDQTDGCEAFCSMTNNGAEICDEKDNDCDFVVDEGCACVNGQTKPCGSGIGDCRQGTQSCVNGQWTTVCSGETLPQNEVCDGHDNDCDGIIDDGFILSSDPNNCGVCGNKCGFLYAVSECRNWTCNMVSCIAGHYDLNKDPFDGCEYSCTLTGDEACDQIDNDCDGLVDEDYFLETDPENCGQCGHECSFLNANSVCNAGLCGISSCASGFVDADKNIANGCEYKCTPEVQNETTAYCDGHDNDCDTQIDEGCTCINGQTIPCLYPAKGLCQPGQQLCSNGQWGQCLGGIGPQAEVCDSADNDCDGQTDEGYNLMTDPENCGTCGHACRFQNGLSGCSAGVCQMIGCLSGHYDIDHNPSNGCEYDCTPTGAEACDMIDNDCDGLVDENFNLQSDPNNCGWCGNKCNIGNAVSACESGLCVKDHCKPNYWDRDSNEANGCEYYCVQTVAVETTAYCQDNLDNDCDGAVDEGCVCTNGEVRPCGYPLVGICLPGQQVCSDGYWSTVCTGGTPPAVSEVCNGLDDDCDGVADDGFNLETDPNSCGSCFHQCAFNHASANCVSRVCQIGPCNSGYVNLNQNPADGCECALTNGGTEVCDGIDNDCDGQIDEGLICGPSGDVSITWTLPNPVSWIYFCSDFSGMYVCETIPQSGSVIIRTITLEDNLYKFNINFSDSPYWGVYNNGQGGLSQFGTIQVSIDGVPTSYLLEPNHIGGGDALISLY